MTKTTRADDIKQSIFGVSDGLTSALGVVIPLAMSHRPMLSVLFGLAFCASVGMGGGEYLSDKNGNKRSALFMALASFTGTILPGLPFLLMPHHYYRAAFVAGGLVIGTIIVIAEVKRFDMPRWLAYVETFAILFVAALLTVVFAFLTGEAG